MDSKKLAKVSTASSTSGFRLLIKNLGRFSATMQYTASKISPFASAMTLTTVIAMYTGWPWLWAFTAFVMVAIITMAVVHFSGLIRAEQEYMYGELPGLKEG